MTFAPQALLARIEVPRASSTRDITVLETAMLGLTLDKRQAVALEIAGTATSRAFYLRAATPVALRHLVAQMQARYPQAEIAEASEDPLARAPGEIASVVELCPAAAAYLPLRTLSERELLKEGADPLLGVLAAFTHVPEHSRAIVQLALSPIPATWSRGFRRRAVEHPLEAERLHERQRLRQAEYAPSSIRLLMLVILVVLLLLSWRFQQDILAHTPAWAQVAALAFLHGQTPRLTGSEIAQLVSGGGGGILLFLALLGAALLLKKRFFQTPIYDMRLVDEKTGRIAYQVCLRLIVLSPGGPISQTPTWRTRRQQLRAFIRQSLKEQWRTLFTTVQAWRSQRYHLRETVLQPQREVLALFTAAYRQYHTASGGSFTPHYLTPRQICRLWQASGRQPGWTRALAHSRHLLSVADLATLWHLPQAQDVVDLPYITRGRARTLLAPTQISFGQGTRLGISTHAGQTMPVYLPAECLRHNLLAVASTGKGKSTLFGHLARAALQDSTRGLVVVEPHGDLIAYLCGCVPAQRREEVALIDLADLAFPVGINPLDMSLGRDRDKAVDNLIQIAGALWAESYGPRTENVLEYAAKTLAEANTALVKADPTCGPARQYTLLDIVPLLRRTSFRHAVLEQVADQVLLEWWQTYYEPLDLRMQSEVTSSVITKLSKFASSRVARRILGQAQTSVNFQEIIQQGKILLVSTASGVVGADLSAFLGATLLGLLQATLAEQAIFAPEQRRPVLMLIDEFQVYSGVNYQTMLAELRKYGGSFGLATQSLSYLDHFDRALRATVLANIDHLFAFTMASEDASLLHLDEVEVADVTALDDYQCYVRLSLAGQRLPLFSLHLDAPLASDARLAREVAQRSQQRYAHPVGRVDTALDEAITRQRTSLPTRPINEDEPSVVTDPGQGAPAPSARKKRRGRGGTRSPKAGATTPTSQTHLMYPEEAQDATSRDQSQCQH
jgi:hypothetical protein